MIVIMMCHYIDVVYMVLEENIFKETKGPYNVQAADLKSFESTGILGGITPIEGPCVMITLCM